MCYQQAHGALVEELKATVSALAAEVGELRGALQRFEAREEDVPTPSTRQKDEPWQIISKKKRS